jgi:hypothetical protein
LAAVLSERAATAAGAVATTEVTHWSHDDRYRVEVHWSPDQSIAYDVSDWGELLILQYLAASGNHREPREPRKSRCSVAMATSCTSMRDQPAQQPIDHQEPGALPEPCRAEAPQPPK